MNGKQWSAGWIAVLGLAVVAAAPGRAQAQYNCAVNIEMGGKNVLAGQIRDEKRPSTPQLWELLQTLSFNEKEKGLTKENGGLTLKGDVRVIIDGAGQVKLSELRLVPNKFDATAWVIAPEDVARILKIRKEGQPDPK